MADGDYSMDRPRPASARNLIRALAWGAAALAAVVLFVVADRFWLRAAAGLERADIMVATVERGRLPIDVQGAGALAPASERWIASRVPGAVQDVYVRPGQQVAAGTTVVRLVNPQLEQAVVRNRLALAEANAEHRRKLSDFTDRRLAAQARVLDRQASYDENRLRLEAQTELRDTNAISDLDYKSTQIRTEQARQNVDFERRRFAELDAALAAELAASEARLAASEAALEDAERQLGDLAVSADAAGTLRELLVEPGERIMAGKQVARVVDSRSLVGAIRVPESYAARLAAGQRAVATVLNVEVPCEVVRVDPAVTQGSVAVELEFAAPLPAGARPDLSMRAVVTVAELDDVLFVRRPSHVRDERRADVFRLAEDGQSAARTPVRFGFGTLRDIEVRDGLDEGDAIILGDTARFEDEETIAIR